MFRSTYVDCEFLRDDMTRAGLISIGITDRADNDYYAVNSDMDEDRIRHSPDEAAVWLREHVWPLLPLTPDGALDRAHADVKPTSVIRQEVGQYYEQGPKARLYAFYGVQDAARVQGLYDHDWGRTPEHVPRRLRDLADLAEDIGLTSQDFPVQTTPVHHALWDAKHNRLMHDTILGIRNAGRPPAQPPMSAEDLRELALNSQRRGPGLTAGRTKQALVSVMPDFMRDAVDAHVPGLSELRAAAAAARDRYERELVAWLGTLD
ncbi:hypothetical protein [Streptomyces sp. NPDC054865]